MTRTTARSCSDRLPSGGIARRLLLALDLLAQIGPIDGGGCCRLALTDEDKAGRDLVVGWMRELGLEVSIDAHRQRLRPARGRMRLCRR